MDTLTIGERTLKLEQGDITRYAVDAIVNAANSTLLGGGGVDGAIHRAGGHAIFNECLAIVGRRGPLPAGQAVKTTGGRMPAKNVIHTVGPVWHGGKRDEASTLASCYRESLRVAEQYGLKTVAFPSISTGAFGYPVAEAAAVALGTVAEFLRSEAVTVREVTFVLYDAATFGAYADALEALV
ncbi:MAG: O-acetyl-ADP-ribose deacetylase [Actinobacteria bacterium]|nr:O-acetyl-ADP-ribose deacetylase [Actinomycetota bacterium]